LELDRFMGRRAIRYPYDDYRKSQGIAV